jgi:predicted phosphoadenosine phosphosulfate sulfurtransferase
MGGPSDWTASHLIKKKILLYIRTWEGRGYPNGIPDEAPLTLEAAGKVPSYRMICLAIMKNDVTLTTLGYQREPCESYTALKRIELKQRGVRVESVQLRLDFEVSA